MTEQNISRPLAESISALLDNQASELELQRILRASQTDPEVNRIWERYQIASSVMRRDMPALAPGDFASRVSAAIAGEEEVQQTSTVTADTKPLRWWQNAARFAVAASVAGGVILFSQSFEQTVTDAPAIASAESSAPAAISLPSGYHGQPLSLRTVGMQNGYEVRQQDNRQVMFVPRQTSTPTPTVTNEELVEYFNELVEVHADHAALNSSQGLLPFARVVLTEED